MNNVILLMWCCLLKICLITNKKPDDRKVKSNKTKGHKNKRLKTIKGCRD